MITKIEKVLLNDNYGVEIAGIKLCFKTNNIGDVFLEIQNSNPGREVDLEESKQIRDFLNEWLRDINLPEILVGEKGRKMRFTK